MSATVVPAIAFAETIRVETRIAAPPAEIWAAVRDVGAVHTRLVPGFVTDTRLDDRVRTVTFANGMIVRELIVGVDDTAMRLAYTAIGTRAAFHAASMQVVPDGRGARLIWLTDIMPEELKGMIAANMTQASAVIRKTLEGAAAATAR